ncbi:MAG: sugar phosphate isomerase/epimerase [Anaerolineae bacterium]|nr:sugar phosphate isomerase/epimerase [Anaerolineae bacterium]
MELSITTDYAKDTGNPEPYLRRIAEAGFSHIHWCHHWNTDFLYSRYEIEQIQHWLQEFHLQLLDLHGSSGVEKNWASSREYERLSGVELVQNRIAMAAHLGSGVVIMHVWEYSEPIKRSLDELEPFARAHGVRIALENLGFPESFEIIAQILADYSPDYLGLCYDAGHGNLSGCDGLTWLEKLKDRLISVHLHDNDGQSDQHKPLFSGTIDWERLADIMARSSYEKCVSMELSIRNVENKDEPTFLQRAYQEGVRLTEMIRAHRKG